MAISTTLALAFKNGTISTTAIAMADIGGSGLGFSAEDLNTADRARITCVTQAVSYRYDGGVPTAAGGHILPANGETIIEGNENVKRLQFIRAGGSDGAISITLEKF